MLRIYNLFPKLIGPIRNWYVHLDRIIEMDFNWIYVNPLNYPGFSGSIYSIKYPRRMNPLFVNGHEKDLGEQARELIIEKENAWDLLKEFINECHRRNLFFMQDLVINHVAIDSPLIQDHPEWFTKRWMLVEKLTGMAIKIYESAEKPKLNDINPQLYQLEKRVAHPFAIDPRNSNHITIWGDLAEINFEKHPGYESLLQYWKDYIDFCLDLGINGFRCDAAYQVPKQVWKTLIKHTKSQNPDFVFLAENLGCTHKQSKDIVEAGFDYIHSSSKWWNLEEPWCVDQYNYFRKYAPSVSFPESHDTERLCLETNKNKKIQIFRYLFAAVFSESILMPIGYEYGFVRKLHVVSTTPDDWEQPVFDITEEITQINHLKQKYRCLSEDGPIEHFQAPDPSLFLLRKASLDEKQYLLLVYNKDGDHSHLVEIDDLGKYLPLSAEISRLYINNPPQKISSQGFSESLDPNEYLLWFQQ
ncbi:MAG: alpha-amylase [Promethearchaeota archaeon]|nr:MAG: alpha-amylase [Candidatus Lokiarchaeota archaeon]